MVRDRIIYIHSEKPKPVQPLGQGREQLAFRTNIIKNKKKEKLQNNRRRNRYVAVNSHLSDISPFIKSKSIADLIRRKG
jgi:hypothetical protein